MIIGLVAFQTVGQQWFPARPGEINLNLVLGAALVGAGSAAIGALVGSLLGRLKKK
jgi:hypothetical protein